MATDAAHVKKHVDVPEWKSEEAPTRRRRLRTGSEFPGDGAIRMRIVRAEITGLDPRAEVVAKKGKGLRDPLDGFLDSSGDSRACPFGMSTGSAVSAAK